MSTPPLRAGKQREPLPNDASVFRLIKKTTNDGRVSPDEFELSTLDKQSALQSLSVWADRLTTPEQAREFLGDKKSSYVLYCTLDVERVRALRPEPDEKTIGSLDVVWDALTITQTGNENTTPLAGAEGHCGLTGLMRLPGLSKLHFFSLRSQLADIASNTLTNIEQKPYT